jgi:hypothetical protein
MKNDFNYYKLNLISYLPWAVFFCVVLLFKFIVIYFYKNSITISWDQWDGEVVGLYPKWLSGQLGLPDLVAGHNEHRLLITRIYNLILFKLNGNYWSIMLQIKVNAFLHVLSLTILLYLIGRNLSTILKWILSIVGCIAFSIPYAYENTLVGFQSQFYFLMLCSILLLASACFFKERDCLLPVFFLSIAIPFTMASGPLAIFVAVLVLIIRLRNNQCDNRTILAYYLVMFIISLIGAYAILMTPKVSGHELFKARSFHQLFEAFVNISAWPFPSNIFFSLIMQIPLFGFVLYFIYKIKDPNSDDLFLFSLIIWLWLQLISISYGRAVLAWSPRYKDIYVFTAIFGVSAVTTILNRIKTPIVSWQNITASIWIASVCAGFLMSINDVNKQLVVINNLISDQKKGLSHYLKTGDDSLLYQKFQCSRPYPIPERLKWILSKPEYRYISDQACSDVGILHQKD